MASEAKTDAAATEVYAVVGATGNTGHAAVKFLSELVAAGSEIRAGTRRPDSDKAKALALLANVKVVKADMTDSEGLKTGLFAGATAAYITPPSSGDRTVATLGMIKAANEAGVNRLVLVSGADTEADPSNPFSVMFKAMEDAAKATGLVVTTLRCPFFMENTYGHAGSIKDQNTFYTAQALDAKHSPIAISDIGRCVAHALVKPASFGGKTFTLAGPTAVTENDLAAAFTKVLGREITATSVPESALKATLEGYGTEPDTVTGIARLVARISAGALQQTDEQRANVKTITGEDGITLQKWVAAAVATGAFGSVGSSS